jgi:hypothetical protein
MQVRSSAMFSELPVLYTTGDLPCFVPKTAYKRRFATGILEPSLAVCICLRRVAAFTCTWTCCEVGTLKCCPYAK